MLSDIKVRNAKAKEKAYKLADSGGLHLYVSTAGGRLWRWKYRFGGVEKVLSIGPYPDVSVAQAREHRDNARLTLREGRDPAVIRKLQRAAHGNPDTTFESIAREWYGLNKANWTDRHAADVILSLETHIFPTLGAVQIRDIAPANVLDTLRVIEERPAVETARRVRQRVSAVFVHAIASGRADTDPASMVRGAMTPVRRKSQPAITELDDARAMLRRAEEVPAHPVTKLGLRLLALTAVRPSELRASAWPEFLDLRGAEPMWRIPAERMKMKREHLVPLSRQAVEVIETVHKLTGRGPMAFPNAHWAHRPMSENAMGYLLHRAGFHGQHVPHGWRSTFSTVMNERFRNDQPVIDLMLAHKPAGKIEAVYNRSLHLERRRELAQLWADLLLEGAPPAMELLEGPRR